MNFLCWGEPIYSCDILYPGALLLNIILSIDYLLLIITCISLFFVFYKKNNKKKKTTRIFCSFLYSFLVGISYYVLKFILSLFSGMFDTSTDDWSCVISTCIPHGVYLIELIIFYILFVLGIYTNIRIWYDFIDKSKKNMKNINKIFIVVSIAIFIILLFTKGTLNILNQ